MDLRNFEDGYQALEANASQKSNMETFVSNYGVSMEIPGYAVRGAKVFPADPNYCVQVVSYVLPSE